MLLYSLLACEGIVKAVMIVVMTLQEKSSVFLVAI